jgi:PhnB protein
MTVKPVPDGYHTVTPYLIVPGADKLIDFLKQAFDAKEIQRMAQPDGTVMHAELRIGDSIIMMGDAAGESQQMPGSLHLYMNDTDAIYKRALRAGATSIMEPADQFYGDRMAGVKDAFGNTWWIATHIEDVSPEGMKKRAEDLMKQKAVG